LNRYLILLVIAIISTSVSGCAAIVQPLIVTPSSLAFTFSADNPPSQLNQTLTVVNNSNSSTQVTVSLSSKCQLSSGFGVVYWIDGLRDPDTTTFPMPLAPNGTLNVTVQVLPSGNEITAGNYTCGIDISAPVPKTIFSRQTVTVPVTVTVTPGKPKPPTPTSTVQNAVSIIPNILIYAAVSALYIVLIFSLVSGRLILKDILAKVPKPSTRTADSEDDQNA
jgi:hypothetical protein